MKVEIQKYQLLDGYGKPYFAHYLVIDGKKIGTVLSDDDAERVRRMIVSLVMDADLWEFGEDIFQA